MIYVMSDIHGNMRLFRSVMEQINLQREDTLYVLGDVMDRYPDGVTILQELMVMPTAKLLMGNHDYMMLCVMDTETIRDLDEIEQYKAPSRWYRNHGDITKQALEDLDEATRERILAFVRNLPLSYEIEVNGQSFRLLHAAPLELYRSHRWSYNSSTEFAVWHRWPLYEELPFDTDTIFIFGHTPTHYFNKKRDPLEIYRWKNRIAIDCGAGFPPDEVPHGRLACLRLDDMQEFYSDENLNTDG